jgi:hypothetical protein
MYRFPPRFTVRSSNLSTLESSFFESSSNCPIRRPSTSHSTSTGFKMLRFSSQSSYARELIVAFTDCRSRPEPCFLVLCLLCSIDSTQIIRHARSIACRILVSKMLSLSSYSATSRKPWRSEAKFLRRGFPGTNSPLGVPSHHLHRAMPCLIYDGPFRRARDRCFSCMSGPQ